MLPSEIRAATEQLANEGIVNLIPSGDSSWIIIKKPKDEITEQILTPYDINVQVYNDIYDKRGTHEKTEQI